MATSIYLGMPPANVVRWIEENVKTGPIFKDETQVVYTDGTTWEGLIEGELAYDWIHGIKENIKEVTIGTEITRIGYNAFSNCVSLVTFNIISSSYKGLINSLPNSTTTQVEQWFNSNVFGYGNNVMHTGPAEYTITCKDGIVHAIGIVEEYDFGFGLEYDGIGWDITITPL